MAWRLESSGVVRNGKRDTAFVKTAINSNFGPLTSFSGGVSAWRDKYFTSGIGVGSQTRIQKAHIFIFHLNFYFVTVTFAI